MEKIQLFGKNWTKMKYNSETYWKSNRYRFLFFFHTKSSDFITFYSLSKNSRRREVIFFELSSLVFFLLAYYRGRNRRYELKLKRK